MNTADLDRLAALFTYPQGQRGCVGFGEPRAEDGPARQGAALSSDNPEAKSSLDAFEVAMGDMPLEDRQELFVRTFELNPVCTLEVGWQLYGEHYERGTFLVRMRDAMRQLNVPESAELPDYLAHVLQVLGRMPEDQAGAFAADFLLRAVEKMHESLRETDNPYRHLLRATRSVIEAIAAQAPQEVDNGR